MIVHVAVRSWTRLLFSPAMSSTGSVRHEPHPGRVRAPQTLLARHGRGAPATFPARPGMGRRGTLPQPGTEKTDIDDLNADASLALRTLMRAITGNRVPPARLCRCGAGTAHGAAVRGRAGSRPRQLSCLGGITLPPGRLAVTEVASLGNGRNCGKRPRGDAHSSAMRALMQGRAHRTGRSVGTLTASGHRCRARHTRQGAVPFGRCCVCITGRSAVSGLACSAVSAGDDARRSRRLMAVSGVRPSIAGANSASSVSARHSRRASPRSDERNRLTTWLPSTSMSWVERPRPGMVTILPCR